MNRNSKIGLDPTISPAPTSLGELRLVLKVPAFGQRWGVQKTTAWKWLVLGLPHLKLSTRNVQVPVAEGDAWVRQTFLRQRQG